jgi:hypothetical protein
VKLRKLFKKLFKIKRGSKNFVKFLIALSIIARLWDLFLSFSFFLKDPNGFLEREANYFARMAFENPNLFNICALIAIQAIGILAYATLIIAMFHLKNPLEKIEATVICLIILMPNFLAPLTWIYPELVYWMQASLPAGIILLIIISLSKIIRKMRQ